LKHLLKAFKNNGTWFWSTAYFNLPTKVKFESSYKHKFKQIIYQLLFWSQTRNPMDFTRLEGLKSIFLGSIAIFRDSS
jgi:hypothetical protein